MQRKPDRSELGIGDFVRALAELGIEDPDRIEILARCMGLEYTEVTHHPEPPTVPPDIVRHHQHGGYNPNRVSNRRSTPKPLPALKPSGGVRLPVPPPEPSGKPLPIQVKVQDPEIPQLPRPDDFKSVSPLERPLKSTRDAPSRVPLIPVRTTRGVLGEVIGTWIPGEQLDIEAMIGCIVRGKPLVELPRMPKRTTRLGCQLLLDFNDALLPWHEDMRELRRSLERLLGEDQLEVYRFDESPFEASGLQKKNRGEAWRPRHQVPVILATDLGVFQAADALLRPGTSTWLRFKNYCNLHQVGLTALVPLHPRRWPPRLEGCIDMIHWNPDTTAVNIRVKGGRWGD